MDEERRYSLVETARILAMSRRWVEKQVQLGELEAERYGGRWRVSSSDLEAFIRRHRRPGNEAGMGPDEQ